MMGLLSTLLVWAFFFWAGFGLFAAFVSFSFDFDFAALFCTGILMTPTTFLGLA